MIRVTTSNEESRWIEEARRGDRRAFDEIVRRYEGRVRSYFASRVRDPHHADDLVQETFVVACRKLSSFDLSLPFFPWLKGIAGNLLKNDLRKVRPEPSDEILRDLESFVPQDDADWIALLRACVGRLEGPAAALVRERYQEGLSVREMAARRGKNPQGVSMALVRVRALLRECLARSSGETP